MRALERQVNTSSFVPDYMARAIIDIDFKMLKQRGVRFIAFDADSTLVPFRGKALSEEARSFLAKQRQLFTDWCIASNRLTNDLLPLGESIDAQVIRATWLVRKPQQRFFAQVIRHFGCQPHEIAMIGDKLLADIWGAKRAGMVTVWVERVGPDSPWDQVLQTRTIERRILRRYVK